VVLMEGYVECARVSDRVTITKIHLYLFPDRD
jgi:hypothetical protein